MLLAYNPFNCDIDELTPDHLAVLRDTSEGWYIEYKREASKTRDIAKSLSAFANHYGGWIFYGIVGSDDGRNTAESFPGMLRKR
jgi:predicted HTH transcriptional regulator